MEVSKKQQTQFLFCGEHSFVGGENHFETEDK